MTHVSLSELIGYWIWTHKQNYCIISITRRLNLQNRVSLLSSLLIKNLPILVTMKAIAGDQFWKTEIPHTVFLFDVFGIFGPNFKAIRQILIPYQFVQRGTTREETKSVFSLLRVYKHFTPLLRHMSTLWIPQMPTANWDAGNPACGVPRDSAQDTSWVRDYSSGFLCDMPGGKKVFEAERNRMSSGINGPDLFPS